MLNNLYLENSVDCNLSVIQRALHATQVIPRPTSGPELAEPHLILLKLKFIEGDWFMYLGMDLENSNKFFYTVNSIDSIMKMRV